VIQFNIKIGGNMPEPLQTLDVEPHETRMDRDWNYAMNEGDQFFKEDGPVWLSLRKLTRRLRDLNLSYAVAGGLALFKHRHRRFTEDIDILITPEVLKSIHDHLDGLGYLALFTGSKNLRDTETGVRIEFLLTGQFPGDGLPKALAFPNPDDVATEFDGVRYINLPTLIGLKLASGMTGGVSRMKDLADVVALIQSRQLPAEFADQLHPYAQAKFLELWEGLSSGPKSGPDGE
jgi:hypothetical protein